MRIRFSLSLPGPFTLTSGGGRSSAVGWLILAGLLYLGAWYEWTIPMLIGHGVCLLGFVLFAVFDSPRMDEQDGDRDR